MDSVRSRVTRLLPSLRRGKPVVAPRSGWTVAGVDLGETLTKVVVLDAGGEELRLVGWADQPTPPGMFFGGRPVRPVDAAAWVRRLLAQVGARPDTLVMAVPGADVQVKRLPVPHPADRESTLRNLAANAAFRTAGEGGSAWSFDYHVLDPETGTVLAVAGRHEGIQAVQAVARTAGFPPERRRVSVPEVALANAWASVASDPAERVILVEGGHTAVTVVLVDQGKPLAWRRVLFAGRELEERSGGAALSENLPPPLVEEWGGRIVQEVRVVVGSALRGSASGDLPPVVFAGGLARLPGLADALGRRLGVEVRRFDPFAAAWVEGEEGPDGAGLGVAWGLAVQALARPPREAIGGVEAPGGERGGGIDVDLSLPDDPAAAARIEDVRALVGALARDGAVRGAGAFAVLVLAVCLGGDVWLSRRAAEGSTRLEGVRGDSLAAQVEIERMARLHAERQRLGTGAEAILALDRSRDVWPRLMDRLSRVIPPYTWVDSLATAGAPGSTGEVPFVLRGTAGSPGEVALLARALVGGPVIEAGVVRTGTVRIGGLPLVRWEIQGRAGASPRDAASSPAEAGMPNSGIVGYGPENRARSGRPSPGFGVR